MHHMHVYIDFSLLVVAWTHVAEGDMNVAWCWKHDTFIKFWFLKYSQGETWVYLGLSHKTDKTY